MRFNPSLAEIRFGYGLSPALAPPGSADDMRALLAGPDRMARTYPIPSFDQMLPPMHALRRLHAARRKTGTQEAADAADAAHRRLRDQMRRDQLLWLNSHFARRSWTRDAFRERLVAFWADHFTARGKVNPTRWAMSPYVESALRPHVTGRFATLLVNAVTAPQMILYLDQEASLGPSSRRAQKTARPDGLNENLAREILELHTLGVDGPYTQTDVRQLAELLTGLGFSAHEGTLFRRSWAEPGPETVLGRTYGQGQPASMEHIIAVLEDLAVHPAAATHIAHKLAVHFVSDTPDPALVTALAARFSETGGDLMAMYEALLEHPASWDPAPGNLRPPLDWVSAALRALAVPPAHLITPAPMPVLKQLPRRLERMGQPYEQPSGPDGWPEEDAFWLTPQGIAARLDWALRAPRQLGLDLPDPRDFVETALGPRAGDRMRFVAAAAESRADGIGLILAAPEFQRS